ncbi:hypothetical protein [Vreelandella rituensis]
MMQRIMDFFSNLFRRRVAVQEKAQEKSPTEEAATAKQAAAGGKSKDKLDPDLGVKPEMAKPESKGTVAPLEGSYLANTNHAKLLNAARTLSADSPTPKLGSSEKLDIKPMDDHSLKAYRSNTAQLLSVHKEAVAEKVDGVNHSGAGGTKLSYNDSVPYKPNIEKLDARLFPLLATDSNSNIGESDINRALYAAKAMEELQRLNANGVLYMNEHDTPEQVDFYVDKVEKSVRDADLTKLAESGKSPEEIHAKLVSDAKAHYTNFINKDNHSPDTEKDFDAKLADHQAEASKPRFQMKSHSTPAM